MYGQNVDARRFWLVWMIMTRGARGKYLRRQLDTHGVLPWIHAFNHPTRSVTQSMNKCWVQLVFFPSKVHSCMGNSFSKQSRCWKKIQTSWWRARWEWLLYWCKWGILSLALHLCSPIVRRLSSTGRHIHRRHRIWMWWGQMWCELMLSHCWNHYNVWPLPGQAFLLPRPHRELFVAWKSKMVIKMSTLLVWDKMRMVAILMQIRHTAMSYTCIFPLDEVSPIQEESFTCPTALEYN